MSDDNAGRITKLCTVNGSLPFGSPLSPILCALVHDDVFSRAASEISAGGNKISLWVDDLVISGQNVSKGSLQTTKRLLQSKGLKTHKEFRTSGRQGAVITGTYVGKRGISPTNKAHKKMRDCLEELDVDKLSSGDSAKVQSLIGQTNHFLQIYRSNTEMAKRLRGRLAWLHNVRRKIDDLPQPLSTATQIIIETDDGSAPW